VDDHEAEVAFHDPDLQQVPGTIWANEHREALLAVEDAYRMCEGVQHVLVGNVVSMGAAGDDRHTATSYLAVLLKSSGWAASRSLKGADLHPRPHPPAESWGSYRKKIPTCAVRIDGPFTVESREGVFTCENGCLAIDNSAVRSPDR